MDTNATVRQNVSRLTGLSVLVAIIFVLTYISTFVKFGPFSITLSLVPIVIGSCLYGTVGACVVGSAFSLAIYLIDPTATYLMSLSFFSSLVVIWFRALAVGLVCTLGYRLLSRKNETVAVIFSSILCPIANTGFFLLGMFVCYRPILEELSGSSAVLKIIISMTGLNFIIEMAVNVLLSTAVSRIMKQIKTMHGEVTYGRQ